MIEVRQTSVFKKWLGKLRDRQSAGRIEARLIMIAATGNFGDSKHVGENVYELRFHFGPGYRVYYIMRGATAVLLLAGGDKSTQSKDIDRAIALSKE